MHTIEQLEDKDTEVRLSAGMWRGGHEDGGLREEILEARTRNRKEWFLAGWAPFREPSRPRRR